MDNIRKFLWFKFDIMNHTKIKILKQKAQVDNFIKVTNKKI